MATTIELKEARAGIWERMKALVDGAEAENRNLSAEEDANWTKANADINDLDARIARQEALERRPATEQQQRQTAVLGNVASLRASPEYAKAFRNWIQLPPSMLDPESRNLMAMAYQSADTRAQAVNSGAAGGYFVPEGFMNRVEQALLTFGGMREAATIMRTDSGNDIPIPTSNDTSNEGELLAENTPASEQDVTVGARVLKSFMYSTKIIRASYQFLQDSAIDVEGWLAELMALRIARITNRHFTLGVGANEPSGIAGDSTQGVAGATGQTLTVTWDDLISLEHSVDPAYRRNGRYMFRDSTLAILRKQKDGEGRYLWQPGTTSNAPNTINTFPYTINSDVAAMAASANSIFFGDLKKYIIRDVRGLTMMRLEEKYAEYLQVGFLGFSRHDGLLIDAGTRPVKHYTNSAS